MIERAAENPGKTKCVVDLVLKSATEASGGEIFVLKMKSLMIKDLVECVIEEFSPKIGKFWDIRHRFPKIAAQLGHYKSYYHISGM